MTPTLTALALISIDSLFFISFAEDPLLALADSFGYDFCHFVTWVSLVMTFIIFLRTLRERFTALNSLLRFAHILPGLIDTKLNRILHRLL